MYVVLVYDITLDTDGPRVLRRVFKTCKRYLVHVQKSVFEGELTASQLMQLRYELQLHLREDKDSVIVFQSRTEKWLTKEFWGMEDDKCSSIL